MEIQRQNFKFTSVVVVFVLDCKNICRTHWYITAVVKVRVFVQTAVFVFGVPLPPCKQTLKLNENSAIYPYF